MKKSNIKNVWAISVLSAVIPAFSGCLPAAALSEANLLSTANGASRMKGSLNSQSCLSANASVVGLSDTAISFKGGATIGGSVVLLGSSTLQLSGNASVSDRIYAANSDQVSKNGNARFGQLIQKDLTQNEAAVFDFIDSLAQEPADYSIAQISSSKVLIGKGGLNVVRVDGDIALSSGILSLRGGAEDRFIVQVQGNLKVTGKAGIQTQGELSPRNIIFIMIRDNSKIDIAGKGDVVGTFFARRGSVRISGNGKIQGSLFAWNSIDITGNGLSIDPAPFCPSTTIPGTNPTPAPTSEPTPGPTSEPTPAPTSEPTPGPTSEPTPAPTSEPTPAPTSEPTPAPTSEPTPAPTPAPTAAPEPTPTSSPSPSPSEAPPCVGLACGVLGG